MRVLWRALAVLAVFLGVGYATMHLLIARGMAHGTPEYDLRLGGAMGGLFVGGAAASLVALLFLLGGRRAPAQGDEQDPE